MYQRHNDPLISDELIAGPRDSEHACGILKFLSRWLCKSDPCEAGFHARGLPQPPQRARLSVRLSLQESCVWGPELMTTWKVCYWVGRGGLNPRRLNDDFVALGIIPGTIHSSYLRLPSQAQVLCGQSRKPL